VVPLNPRLADVRFGSNLVPRLANVRFGSNLVPRLAHVGFNNKLHPCPRLANGRLNVKRCCHRLGSRLAFHRVRTQMELWDPL
jgi:hypothetical protein